MGGELCASGNAGGDPPGDARGDAIAAALHWWHLAGVDVAVRPTPASWLRHPAPLNASPEIADAVRQSGSPRATGEPRRTALPAEAPAGPVPRGKAVAASLAPAQTSMAAVAELDALRSLDALLAHVRSQWPGAPFLDGAPRSGLLLLGEAPSRADLASGRPFSGPAGALLDSMLAAIGRDRTTAAIAIMTPGQRVAGPPSPQAIARDLPLVRALLRLAAPRLLVLLGGIPARTLAGSAEPISALRGRDLQIGSDGVEVPAIATFNPAYLLRRPEEKAKAWADLRAIARRLAA